MNNDVSELDIHRSAMIFIKQYGDNASAQAAFTALNNANSLSMEGLSVWCRIVDAIKKIQSNKPMKYSN